MTTGWHENEVQYSAMTNVPNLSLTADDDTILLEIYQNDIVDADGLCGLLSHRSGDSLRVRVRNLAKAGFIGELKQPLYRNGGGSYAKRYRLADLGARRLVDMFRLPIPTTRWKTKNLNLTQGHIKHALQETNLLFQLRGSVRKRDNMSFHFPHEIYKKFRPDLLKKKTLPVTLRTEVNWFDHRGVEGTKPDRFGMLHYKNNPIGKQNRFLFFEIDMGTETIDPSDRVMNSAGFWRGSSILRKWVVYGQGFSNRAHTDIFGIPTFQVLHVTTTPSRAKEMIKGYQHRLASGPGAVAPSRFLFTDFQTVRRFEGDILEIPVFNGAGKTMTLGAGIER
jgi:protein involved in plasmid replication-relaxation